VPVGAPWRIRWNDPTCGGSRFHYGQRDRQPDRPGREQCRREGARAPTGGVRPRAGVVRGQRSHVRAVVGSCGVEDRRAGRLGAQEAVAAVEPDADGAVEPAHERSLVAARAVERVVGDVQLIEAVQAAKRRHVDDRESVCGHVETHQRRRTAGDRRVSSTDHDRVDHYTPTKRLNIGRSTRSAGR